MSESDMNVGCSELSFDYLYVVQLDVSPAYEDDFNRIYDAEHLPNIQNVQGVGRCQRYLLNGGDETDMPRYLTTYEVKDPEVLKSSAWRNAADAGVWKDLIRPHTFNRRHSVFKVMK